VYHAAIPSSFYALLISALGGILSKLGTDNPLMAGDNTQNR